MRVTTYDDVSAGLNITLLQYGWSYTDNINTVDRSGNPWPLMRAPTHCIHRALTYRARRVKKMTFRGLRPDPDKKCGNRECGGGPLKLVIIVSPTPTQCELIKSTNGVLEGMGYRAPATPRKSGVLASPSLMS